MNTMPGHVFRRRMDRPLPNAVRAHGVWIEDEDGNRYLDASGGPLVVNIGHGREAVARAAHDQILAFDYVHPTMFTGGPVEDLARSLAEHAPPGIDRFYFMSTGSEAVETAVKLARQIHLAHGRAGRFRLIARRGSYHGLTLGALSATGKTSLRAPFAPMLPETLHIPAPYCFRCAYGLPPAECGIRCANALEEAIQFAGPETVSAFLAETVSGATIAAVPPPSGYWPRIRNICDRYGVLLILDEVLCGIGRTGRWFASERYGVIPDIVTLGKGLAGGVAALSAAGVRDDHFEAVRAGGGFAHGGTFSHHQVAAAVGNAVIRILESERLIERVDELGETLGNKLKERLESHPHVGDFRGVGFLWGVEFVQDKTTSAPFPRSERVAERLWDALFHRGVLLYPATGLAGTDGDAMVVGPPFILAESEMDRLADVLAQAVDDVFDS